jgi:putative DNA primase/helicase
MQKKPTKTPYSVRGGYAKINDPATWATFDEALGALQSGAYNGIGFVFTQTPFVGVDIDGCLDPATGEITPEAIDAQQV